MWTVAPRTLCQICRKVGARTHTMNLMTTSGFFAGYPLFYILYTLCLALSTQYSENVVHSNIFHYELSTRSG
jgi:hypothetical protein